MLGCSQQNRFNVGATPVSKNNVELDINMFNKFNNIVAKDEALFSGAFRTGQVRIAGTEFIPPRAEELECIFKNELPQLIKRCESKTDLAFEIFL